MEKDNSKKLIRVIIVYGEINESFYNNINKVELPTLIVNNNDFHEYPVIK